MPQNVLQKPKSLLLVWCACPLIIMSVLGFFFLNYLTCMILYIYCFFFFPLSLIYLSLFSYRSYRTCSAVLFHFSQHTSPFFGMVQTMSPVSTFKKRQRCRYIDNFSCLSNQNGSQCRLVISCGWIFESQSLFFGVHRL